MPILCHERCFVVMLIPNAQLVISQYEVNLAEKLGPPGPFNQIRDRRCRKPITHRL
jgi:hypothetical protein